MFRKMISLMCALVVTSSITAVSSNAAVKPSDEPAYIYAIDCYPELTITGTTAKCVSTAYGPASVVTRIDAVQQLQEKNSDGDWVLNYCWSETAYSNELTSTKYKYSLSHGRYRLKTVFTIYSGEKYSKYEKVTEYTGEKVV